MVQKKGYKKTKIGWIPEGWKFVELKRFIELGKDKLDPKRAKINLPCIELEHIEQRKGIINGYGSSAKQLSTKNRFSKGDILFGKLRPYLRKFWFAKFDGVCSSEIWVLKGINEIAANEYIFFLIQQHHFIQISNVTSGSKMPRADWSLLSKYPFLLPPLPEQRKIAEILSAWDKAIAHTQKLIESLKLRKKGLMQQLLTGKKRLEGFSGEWKEYAYSDLIKEVKRPVKVIDDELYHLISVRRRSGGIFERQSLEGKGILTKNLKNTKSGDFLISKMQVVHGATGLVTEEFDNKTISGSYISAISKDRNRLDITFFDWLSKMPVFYHQTYISSYGVHIEKMTFNFKSFLKLRVKIPSIEEQKEIVKILELSAEEIKYFENYLVQLQAQKKGLMQQLLTGKKRVKNE